MLIIGKDQSTINPINDQSLVEVRAIYIPKYDYHISIDC